jgi:hypothetical protein
MSSGWAPGAPAHRALVWFHLHSKTMNSDLRRTLASTLCRCLVWTLTLATATAQGPGGPELNVVHTRLGSS